MNRFDLLNSNLFQARFVALQTMCTVIGVFTREDRIIQTTRSARSDDDRDQKILRECAARAAPAVPVISQRQVLHKESKDFSALSLCFVGSCR
ncbi:hypothetical protein N7497_003915 [Penicillium chrysogenum]|nr:hypothetical protein N7497_003915 [Penicillium chrysogenum]